MNPQPFPQANVLLRGGTASRFGTPHDVGHMPVHATGTEVISRWRLTLRERLLVLFRGDIWLRIRGRTHAPVSLQADNPFELRRPGPTA